MALRILALETSGRSGSVAALEGERAIAHVELLATQRSAQALAPAMAQVLAAARWQPRQVELVAVTAGPGSFTGLRVGVTTAKAFAWATGAAVLGVDTLEAIARQAPPAETPIAVVLEAERDEVFAALYGPAMGEVLSPPAIVASDAWLATLEPGWRIAGPALQRLAARLPADTNIVPSEFWQPKAAAVGQLAAWRFAHGQRDDVWQLVPRYFRRSAAEEKWDARTRPASPSQPGAVRPGAT